MGLSVFFFLKHSVSNAGKIHLFLNRHAFGVCHTLSSCSQTESNRRALKYSILFCHIFFCYPMFYSNTTGSQLIFSSQTTKDGQGFIWLHTNRCLVSLIYILTQREQNSNQIYIFLLCPVSICSLLSFSGCRWVYLLRQQVCVLVASHTCTQYWWCMEESELQ